MQPDLRIVRWWCASDPEDGAWCLNWGNCVSPFAVPGLFPFIDSKRVHAHCVYMTLQGNLLSSLGRILAPLKSVDESALSAKPNLAEALDSFERMVDVLAFACGQAEEYLHRARDEVSGELSVDNLTSAIKQLLDAEQKAVLVSQIDSWKPSQDIAGLVHAHLEPQKQMHGISERLRNIILSLAEHLRDTRLVFEVRRAELINEAAGKDAAVAINSDEDLDAYFRAAAGG